MTTWTRKWNPSAPERPPNSSPTAQFSLINMENGQVWKGAWNGDPMKKASYADLELVLRIIKARIDEGRTLLDVDGLVLWAPPETHDAIISFMKAVGGQEWVNPREMERLGYPQVAGMPTIEALEKLFNAEPANFDDKYNRPGARPE